MVRMLLGASLHEGASAAGPMQVASATKCGDLSTAAARAPPPVEMTFFGTGKEGQAGAARFSSFDLLRSDWSGSLAAKEVKSWVPRM